MSFSDAELFQAWQRGRDAEAFQTLTQRYGGLVYAAALRILGNAHEAEEVAQESFVSLAMTSAPPQGALAPWLHRVATNRALDRLRTERNRHRREQAYVDAQGLEAPPVVWNDIFSYVDEAINALPEKYRVPMVRHFNGDTLQKDLKMASGKALTEDFEFTPGGSMIHGRIVSPGLDPESIRLVVVLTRDKGEQQYWGQGNADGTYQVEGISAGSGQVVAFVEGAIRSITNVDIPEDETVEQDIELEAVGSISGMLLGIAPEQIGMVTVLKGAVDLSGLVTVEDIQAFIPEATRIAVFQVKSDEVGHYELVGLPYNTYTLVAVAASRADENDIAQWRWTTMQVVLDENNPQMNLDFNLQ